MLSPTAIVERAASLGQKIIAVTDHDGTDGVAIQRTDRLSFRAETGEIAPEFLYWRGVVLSHFSGMGWDVDLREREGGWGCPCGDVLQVR